jgi:hypothetical protein
LSGGKNVQIYLGADHFLSIFLWVWRQKNNKLGASAPKPNSAPKVQTDALFFP